MYQNVPDFEGKKQHKDDAISFMGSGGRLTHIQIWPGDSNNLEDVMKEYKFEIGSLTLEKAPELRGQWELTHVSGSKCLTCFRVK